MKNSELEERVKKLEERLMYVLDLLSHLKLEIAPGSEDHKERLMENSKIILNEIALSKQ